MTTLLIAGDICPIEGNSAHFQAGHADALYHDLLPELRAADLVIANLECPLVERRTPIEKTGPNFGEPTDCINGIKAGGIDVLCLANNHIMDHGEEGLLNTMRACFSNGIDIVGAGENLQQARKILIKEVGQHRIGILAMAEHEFSIARNDRPGANPLNIADFVRDVQSARARFDYLIVLLHGGDEFLVPSPGLKDTCHFLIEMGANVVVVQHPHSLGGIETYRGGFVIYGQGAFLMDEAIYRQKKSFHEGFLVKLSLADSGAAALDIIPFIQSDPAPGARRMSTDEDRLFRQTFDQRSEAVKDDKLVESQWLRFCEKNKHSYLSALLGHNRILRRLNARGLLSKLLYTRDVRLGSRNVLCCETHREAMATIFDRRLI